MPRLLKEWEKSMPWLDDVRNAWRGLLRAPRFTALAVLVLALGIGGSSAMFGAINTLLFDSVPYPQPHRLVLVSDFGPDGAATPLAYGSFRELVSRSHAIESAAVVLAWQPTLSTAGEPTLLAGQRVSAALFDTLGVRPSAGPGFSATADLPGGPRQVILGHALWRERFAGDTAVIGSEIELDEVLYRVVGVMPAGFRDVLAPSAQLWTLLQYDPALPAQGREWGKHLRMVARLRPDTSSISVSEELARIGASPDARFARAVHADLARGAIVQPLQDALTQSIRPGLLAGSAAVALLLMIACVNVANLLLVRGTQRAHEFAARAALGASPLRLMRHQVIEVLMLSLMGAGLGVGLAHLALASLARLAGMQGVSTTLGTVDGATLMFTTAVATSIGLLLGLVPAIQAVRRGRRMGPHPGNQRGIGRQPNARNLMVVIEVALAAVLLVSAGLLLGSLQRLLSIDSGMQPEGVLSMQIHASGNRYQNDAAVEAFYQQVIDAVREVPGVRSAAFTSQLPMTDDRSEFGTHFEALAGEPAGEGYSVLRYSVSADYLATLGIPILFGRGLDETDRGSASKSVVISQSLAQRRFAGSSPLGRRMQIGPADAGWYTIVGVAGDVRHASLAADDTDAVYVSSTQWHFADRTRSLVVRTQGDPDGLSRALRDAVWSVDPARPITRVASMETLTSRTAGQRQLAAAVFSAFGVTALLLAAMGLYGALSVQVAERTGEIGLRLALGAKAFGVARTLLARAMGMIGLGLLLGLALASGATTALRSLLFGLSATDPGIFLLAALTLGGVGLLASVAPLRRALSISPAQALRWE